MIRFVKQKFFTCSGSPLHIIYKPVVDKNGLIDLKESSKENTDEIIQSYASSCDIQIILNRASNGDLSGLTAEKGIYGDFTEMPKTYAEFLQLQIDNNRMFDSLPKELKKKFDNDPNQFFAQAGQKEWFEKLGMIREKEEVNEKGEES